MTLKPWQLYKRGKFYRIGYKRNWFGIHWLTYREAYISGLKAPYETVLREDAKALLDRVKLCELDEFMFQFDSWKVVAE